MYIYAVSVIVLWGYFAKEIREHNWAKSPLSRHAIVPMIWPLTLIFMIGVFLRTQKDARALNRENLLKEAKQENVLLENQLQALEAELKLDN